MVQLNEQQAAAVAAGDGPALVLAGAGSGKTRVIIERLAWLVEERGVDPRNLLALTFTNKAAAEMRERFLERLGADRVATWLGTFHAFGLFVLRREIDCLGRPKSFTVFDDTDQLSLMKRLVKELPEGYAPVSPRDALGWISQLKQRVEKPKAEVEDMDEEEEETYRLLWTRYHDALRRANALDFDDLLAMVVTLFEQEPEVLAKYQRRYRHVLVDEYQDTNRAQYLIALLLSKGHSNLFVVGDEDQAIYSWRGADISNILGFGRDFPEATVHRLEENYRSTQPILEAANALVANNLNRLGKTLRTSNAEGERVRFYEAEDGEDEARYVAADIVKRAIAPSQAAVLYRTNAQARLIEEAMRRKGLNYVVVGGVKFYARKEIKDLLAYLRLVVNIDDDESLRRVLNVPPRGIGGTSFERIQAYATERKTPLFQVLRDIESDETLSSRARDASMKFVTLIDNLALDAQSDKVAPLVERLLEETGYREYVEKSDAKDFRSRLENVDEFVAGCHDYDAGDAKGLLAYLQDLSLMTDVDRWNANEPAVTLMTCHNAKGLEFDYVYLVGLEEGLLPLLREFDTGEDVEEERRLCYVAMTRARKGLVLSGAHTRTLYGRTQKHREASRFLDEIGIERIERVSRAPGKRKRAHTPTATVDAVRYKTGVRVRHARFGPGTIMFTQGSGDKLRARIRFRTGRTATLMVKQAPLEILEDSKR